MKLDCLLIYVPKLNDYYKLFGNHMSGMYMPMGLLALADIVRQAGYKVQILHLGIEKIENPKFSIKDYLEETKPKVVGLPLHWHFQSYDSIGVAKNVKLTNPEIFIVLGGFTASYFHEEIMKEFDFVDGVIRGDGEFPLLKLTETLLNGSRELPAVPNLTWRDRGRIVINEIKYVAEGQDLDRLNFTNCSLLKNYELYIKYVREPWLWIKGLSKRVNLKLLNRGMPESIFPLFISRGCYVDCSFCDGGGVFHKKICKRSKVIFRSVEKVIESIQEIKNMVMIQSLLIFPQ